MTLQWLNKHFNILWAAHVLIHIDNQTDPTGSRVTVCLYTNNQCSALVPNRSLLVIVMTMLCLSSKYALCHLNFKHLLVHYKSCFFTAKRELRTIGNIWDKLVVLPKILNIKFNIFECCSWLCSVRTDPNRKVKRG